MGLGGRERERNGPKTMKDKSSSPRPSTALLKFIVRNSDQERFSDFERKSCGVSFPESDIFLRVACQDLIAGFVLSFTISCLHQTRGMVFSVFERAPPSNKGRLESNMHKPGTVKGKLEASDSLDLESFFLSRQPSLIHCTHYVEICSRGRRESKFHKSHAVFTRLLPNFSSSGNYCAVGRREGEPETNPIFSTKKKKRVYKLLHRNAVYKIFTEKTHPVNFEQE